MKIFIAVVFAIMGGVSPSFSAEVSTNIPSVSRIVAELNYRDVKIAHLLAFKAQIDDRPLYVESALVAAELTNRNWRLAHVYRHPRETLEHHDPWTVSAVTDVPYKGCEEFKGKPSRAQVEEFIRDTWWEFRPSNGFRLVRGEVYSETWARALGYKPEYVFEMKPK